MREKTVTRRAWAPKVAEKIKRGSIHQAWDKAPFAGGQHLADILITHEVEIEAPRALTSADYMAEGCAYQHALEEDGHDLPVSAPYGYDYRAFNAWRLAQGALYVIRFELTQLTPLGRAIERCIARRLDAAGGGAR